MPKLATRKTLTGKPETIAQPLLNLNLRPFFAAGLFFILVTAPFMRGLFFPAELLLYQVIVGLTFLFCIGDQLLRREEMPRLPLLPAAAGLFGAYLLSLITAVHLRAAIGETLKVLSYLLLFYMSFRYVRGNGDLRRLLLAGYAGAVGVALVGVSAAAGFLAFPGAFENGVINSTLQYKNALAAYLTLFALTGIALSIRTHSLGARLAYAAANTLLVTVILGTQSRAGWLLFPVPIIALVGGLPPAYRWRALYHALIVIGAGIGGAKGFYAAIGRTPSPAGLPFLGAGLLAALLLQLLYTRVARRLNEPTVPPLTRRFVATTGVAYLGAVIILYGVLASGAYPLTAAAFVSPKIAARTASITSTDPSFQQRLLYYHDAVRIVADHPVTGTGGGGWSALYHRYQTFPYWSSEAHSFLFQTWVEAGTLGLIALVAIAFAAGLTVRRLWRRLRYDNNWPYVWGCAVAVLALSLHSVFDFDLSLAALGYLLWALLGSLSAVELLSRRRPAVEIGTGDTAAGKRWPTVLSGVAGLLLAVALIWPSASFYRAGKLGALGAAAIRANDLDRALGYLLAAHRADPFTASYCGDIAQIYAAQAIAQDDAAKHFLSLKWARMAEAREPHNLVLLTALVNLYHYMNEPLKAAATARALLDANPFLTTSYEILAQMELEAAVHLYRQGKAATAAAYLKEIAGLPAVVERREAALSHRRFGGDPPRVTPLLRLLVGQAQALSRDYPAALASFTAAARDPQLYIQAKTWQAAVLQLSGQNAAGAQILAQLTAQDPSVAKRYAEIESLLRLPHLERGT